MPSAASIVGLLQKRVSGYSGISSTNAAVYGVDQTLDSSEPYSEGYGGYFNKLRANGLYLGCRVIDVNVTTTLSNTDVLVSCYNTSNIAVNLPANPYIGQYIEIRRNRSATITVYGNGKSMVNEGTVSSISVGEAAGDIGHFRYDGSNWLYNYSPRKP